MAFEYPKYTVSGKAMQLMLDKILRTLKAVANLLRRIGPDKGGHWEVVKAKPPRRGECVANLKRGVIVP